MPSGPRSSSMNSRTSRPRSPTRDSTTTGADVPFGDHRQQRGLADARAGEQAEALTAAGGHQACRGPGRRGGAAAGPVAAQADRAHRGRHRRACRLRGGPPSIGLAETVDARGRAGRLRPAPAGHARGPATGSPTRSPRSGPSGMQATDPRATDDDLGDQLARRPRRTSSPTAADRPSTWTTRPTTARTRPVATGRAARTAACSLVSTSVVIPGPPPEPGSARRRRGRRRWRRPGRRWRRR